MKTLTRRNVIATLTSTTVLLCPAVLNAQALSLDWDGIPTTMPTGEDTLIAVDAGSASVDVTALQQGEVAVIARPTQDPVYTSTEMTQYIAVLRRTDAQIAAADDRDGTVQDAGYFVVNLVCTHRGKAIGMTGNPDAPFACTDRRSRHSSVYNGSGFGISGASEGEHLSIPDYTIDVGDQVILTLT